MKDSEYESLVELFGENGQRQIRSNEIQAEHEDGLKIALHNGWVESSTKKFDGPIIAAARNSVEAEQRILDYQETKNPLYWLSSKGRYDMAMYRTEKKNGAQKTELEPDEQPTESTTTPEQPRKLLKGWHDITDALDMKYDERNDIKALNDKFKGPTWNEGSGSHPKVYKDALIEWFNHLDSMQQDLANQQKGRKLSAEAQHDYGKEGVVAPEISGSVKKRRRHKRT